MKIIKTNEEIYKYHLYLNHKYQFHPDNLNEMFPQETPTKYVTLEQLEKCIVKYVIIKPI